MDAKRAGQPDSSPTQPASAGTWQARLLARDPALRVHLLGIGGAGLSAIAQVLLEMGVQVSGSDRRPSPVTARLAAAGATIFPAQSAANLAARPKAHYPDVVLISSAIDEANPERRAAEALGIPVLKRLDFFPVLLANRRVLAVPDSAGVSWTTLSGDDVKSAVCRSGGPLTMAPLCGFQIQGTYRLLSTRTCFIFISGSMPVQSRGCIFSLRVERPI